MTETKIKNMSINNLNKKDVFLNPDYFKSVVKYGDLIINHYASKDNPCRKGYFIGFVSHKMQFGSGVYLKMTDDLRKDKGKTWEVYFDQESRLSFAEKQKKKKKMENKQSSKLKSQKRMLQNQLRKIKEIIFNEPATIVFWNDGTKTVVKTGPNDKFDKEKGILWAYFLRHASGTKTKLQKEIASYCKKA